MSRLLLVHGLGGTGATMRELADALVAAGHEVHAPTLPGHGTTPADLAGIGWRDWCDALDDWCGRWRIDVVVGQSMGGALALAAAARLTSMRGVVAINAPAPDPDAVDGLEWRRSRGHLVIDGPPLAEGEDGYERLPIDAVLAMAQGVLETELALVRVPVLLLNGRHDDIVDPASAGIIAAALGGATECHVLADSGHVASLGPGVPAVVERVLAFISALGRSDER